MAMEEALRARLEAETAAVVDWGWNGQGAAVPRIVLSLISDVPSYTTDGPSDLSMARVQIDCYAKTQGAVIGLARQVVAAISGYSATPLLAVFLNGAIDLAPDTTAGEIHARRMLTAMISHRTS